MITLSDVLDWIESLNVAQNYYIGKLNAKREKSVGVYQRGSREPVKAIGNCQTYDIKQITLIVHWNKNPDDTERAAYDIYNKISTAENIKIGQHKVDYISMLNAEPIDISTDELGIYERVIDFDIYYEI